MAHAAAVASTADQLEPGAAGGSLTLALSKITIASPLVLPVFISGSNPAAVACPTGSEPGLVLCKLDRSLGAVSIKSAECSAPHITCSVSCAVQPTASSMSGSQPSVAPMSGVHATLLAAVRLQPLASSGNSLAQPVPSQEMDSDQTAYRCHPALADSALHLGAVQTSAISREDNIGHARQQQTRVPVAMHGYAIPSKSAGHAQGPQPCGKAGRWAVTEAPALHQDGPSSNDVWLLSRGAGSGGGGMQAKGLIGKVISTAKACLS